MPHQRVFHRPKPLSRECCKCYIDNLIGSLHGTDAGGVETRLVGIWYNSLRASDILLHPSGGHASTSCKKVTRLRKILCR